MCGQAARADLCSGLISAHEYARQGCEPTAQAARLFHVEVLVSVLILSVGILVLFSACKRRR